VALVEDIPVLRLTTGMIGLVLQVIPNTTHEGYWFYGLLIHDGLQIVEGRRLQLVRSAVPAAPPRDPPRRTAWDRVLDDGVVPYEGDSPHSPVRPVPSSGMKVFVSSTCYDLIDLRAELEVLLRDMGFSPLLSDRPSSEFEVLPDKNSIETCLANVRNADLFISVLSQRYGPSLKGVGYDDVSATHLEWLEARKEKKPIRVYVRDRLQADHATWRRNTGGKVDLGWVRDPGDHGIFHLLDAHEKLVAAEPKSNWVWGFRDSVELRARIAFDLKAISSRALLTRWLAEGRLPSLRPYLTARQGGHANENATFNMRFAVRGQHPALDARLRVGTGKPLGDITPAHEAAANIEYRMPPAGRLEQEVAVQYATEFGAIIEDTFLLRSEVGGGSAGEVELLRRKLVSDRGVAIE
jgi:Domain of unknown function (DUF4062)